MHSTDPHPDAAASRANDQNSNDSDGKDNEGMDFGDPFDGRDLEAELAAVQQQFADLREEWLRERAEIANQHKRQTRDLDTARRYANERLLGALLPVFDSLEAGLRAAHGESAEVREGLQLTLRQLEKVADDNGLVAIDPVGTAFNPERHQAISTQPRGEHAPGTVLQVFQKGYLLNERLLRPALVVVAADH